MFEYFPGNYVWNLSVVATLNSGGLIDEVDRACRPLREAAAQGPDGGTEALMAAWTRVVDDLQTRALAAEEAGHRRTAGQVYLRAAGYLVQAERMQSASSPERRAVYQRCLHLMQRSLDLLDPTTTRVEVPYGDTSLPAYYTDASLDGEAVPCIIMWNGLDSTKEHMYLSGFQHELAARGVSTLMVDCPGSGEALRLRGLTAQVDTVPWAAACVDHLLGRTDVRPDAIGLVGWSLGGYYVPRAAAGEHRLALAVAWGANHDWGAVQRRRVEREGENPVPHYWEHVLWVWGEPDVESFLRTADGACLDGLVEKITAPLLIVHGEDDRQIPLRYAHRTYDQAVNAARRDLRIFTAAEGGAEHIGLDHLPQVASYIADWIDDVLRDVRWAS